MQSYNDYSDNNLIRAFQSGTLEAFNTLIERYKDRIYTSIFFLVKDHWLAEDIYQDTFIRIIDTLRHKKYNEEGKFLPWAMRISHNLCIDYFRKQKRNAPIITSDSQDLQDILDNINSKEDNAEQAMIRRQSYQTVHELLELLPQDQREVIILRHFADLSFKDIASMTNCSINTALGRMRYGLINLRKMMVTQNAVL